MNPPATLYPLNPAEAVFAPLHDPLLAGLLPLSFHAEQAVNARVVPYWCWTVVTWDDCRPDAMQCTLELAQAIPGRPYDHLILCLTMPADVTARLSLQDSGGEWTPVGEPWSGQNQRSELQLPLPAEGAQGLRLQFKATAAGAQTIGLAWWGVQNSRLLAQIEAQSCRLGHAWAGWIKPEAEWALDQPHCGLLFDGAHWQELRAKANDPAWQPTWELLVARATRALDYAPEDAVQGHLPWQDERYIRASQRGRPALYLDGPALALVGIIRRDSRMVRHAVRTLLAICHARSWACSEECRLPGSSWDIRCFLEEMYSTATALMFDWLASTLTERARELFATKLWDHGLAVIERDLAKYEQVHHINQGPWFGRGRVLGGLLLETLWPRMGGYADRACDDLRADLGAYLLPDGGVDEGPMYHALTLEVTVVPIIAYARRRGREPTALLPEAMTHIGRYYRGLASGQPGRFIPDGDCANDEIVADSIAVLAGLYPDGRFDDLLAVSLPRPRPFSYIQHYGGTGLFAFILGPRRVPPVQRLAPAFTLLPHTGIAAGRIQSGPARLRWQLNGSKANPHHAHRDKGAFLVEIDDQPLFVDRGVVRYEDPRVMAMKSAEMHNVLTPCRDGTTPLDQATPAEPLVVTATGDAQGFNAGIELAPVWASTFLRYRREVSATDPQAWTVRDEGTFRLSGRVVFHLHSPDPFVLRDGRIFAGPPGARVQILAEWADHVVQAPDLIDCNYRELHHLQIRSGDLVRFDLVTRFRRVSDAAL